MLLPASQFPLAPGSVIEQGTIEGMTLTAYKVRKETGELVFVAVWGGVHELQTATPLVRFA